MAVDRKLLISDMQDIETVLLDLEDVTPSGISDKKLQLMVFRCLWHILEYLIRRA